MQLDILKSVLEQPALLRFKATNTPQVQDWAEQLRRTVRRLVWLDKPPVLQSSKEGDRNLEDLLIEEYRFTSEEGRVFRGVVVRPNSKEPIAAVLVNPGKNAKLEEVTGLAAPPYPDANIAQQLARQGLATLTLEYGLLGGLDPTRLENRDETNVLALALGLKGLSPLGLLVKEAVGALYWLEAQTWVKPDNIAIFGRSLGASIALHTALCYPRPIPVSLVAFLGNYPAIFARDLSANGATALPGIMRYADLPDLVAALAPAPLHLQHGANDRSFPIEEASRAIDTVKSSYQIMEADSSLEIQISDRGHGTEVEGVKKFLYKHLGTSVPSESSVPAYRVYFDSPTRLQILDRVDDALTTGSLTLGKYGRQLESMAQGWTGTSHVLAVQSGTAALEICLRLLKVENRTVLVPANTFFATASSVLHAGGKVRFVDIEPEGLGMNPVALQAALEEIPDVAAVIVVHIAGIVSPSVQQVLKLCSGRGIPVVEDAAHALGSQLEGHFAGSLGTFSAFSLYPTKIITSGEGGFVCLNSELDFQEAACYRDQGKQSFTANVHDRLGNNWRLSEVHAAIGIGHLTHLGDFIEERRRLANWYDHHVKDIPGLRIQPIPANSQSNYYKYVVLLEEGQNREALKQRLKANHNVTLSGEVYTIPCCAQPFFQGQYPAQVFPEAYQFCAQHLCLPLFQTMTEAQQFRVVEALKKEI
jgi:perosamine synthetase